MKPTRRQSEEPQESLQRYERTGALDRSQDPDLGASVGQAITRQGESRGSTQRKGQPKECPQFLHSLAERNHLSLELRCVQVHDVQANHGVRYVAEPPSRRGARDAKIRRDRHVAGALDEISKPVIVAPLLASRGRHADDHRPFALGTQAIDVIASRPRRRTTVR